MIARTLAFAFALIAGSCALWSAGPAPEEAAKSTGALLDDAEKALEALEVERAESLLARAKEELAELADVTLRAPLEARRSELADRLPGVKAIALVKRLEAAKSALSAATEKARAGAAEIEAKEPPEAAFDRVREGIADAKAALERGADLEPRDPEYGNSAAASRTELQGIEEKVASKWAAVELQVRRASLIAKTREVDAALRAGDAERAAAASTSLSEAIAKGAELEAKDKSYARVATAAKEAARRAEVFAHRVEVEAADRAVTALLADPAQLDAAEKSIAALEKALAAAPETAKQDRRHSAWTAQIAKKGERYRAAIASKRDELAVNEHRQKVEAAVAGLEAQIEGLIDEKPVQYEKAEAAVTDLAHLIAGASEIRARNRAHDRFLAALERTLDSRRREIVKRRIEKTDALVVNRTGELSSEASFAAAEKALRLLENTIESNAEFLGQEPAYARSVAAAKQRAVAHRAAIDARALEIEVAKARAVIDSALKNAEEKIAAAQVEESFVEAGKAVVDLEAEIDRLSASKDRAFASYLAALKRKIPAYQAELERRRIALEVAAQAEPAREAERLLDEKLTALEDLPDDSAFEAAEAAAKALARVAEKRTPFAEKFSPNGRWIAYTYSAMASGTIAATDALIRLASSTGTNVILDLPNANSAPGDGASSFPTWAVDGSFISFASNRAGGAGDWDLYIAPIDPMTGGDGPATALTDANTSGFEHGAQWSP